MIDPLTSVLQKAGIPAQMIHALVQMVHIPPPGTIDVTELSHANKPQLALLAAVVAAMDTRRFGEALKRLLAFVDTTQEVLSAYDAGRCLHLKGILAWRLDGDIHSATRAFNRSIALLRDADTLQARTYLAWVFDSFGQLLHHQGLLTDARHEFERALQHRDPTDEAGVALTHGNLGRLCMELGDFRAAQTHLQQDLDILTRLSPELTHVLTQLLSHLGTCALECGDLQAAQTAFDHSATLAEDDQNAFALAYTALGLGKIALRAGKYTAAQHQAQAALIHLDAAAIDPAFKHGVRGLIQQLQAEVHLAQEDLQEAILDFEQACASFQQARDVTPVEQAHLLHSLARARRLNGEGQRAAQHLREALRCLDASAADDLRAAIEEELRQGFPESWLLHAAGRFVGQEHIAFLLEHGGRGEFSGNQQDVVILFSDIRGYTSISECFAPDALVAFLNEYLAHMTRCVEYFAGMVDKFIGDAVMAVFSLPTPRADDAERAVMAALMMRDELERFNRKMPEGTPRLATGVGLHAGPVVAGLIGSPQRRSYTIIGDAVNTASRLEGLTKQLGGSILISDEIIRRLSQPERFLLRPLGRYRLKGKELPVTVADVLGEDDGSRFARTIQAEVAKARDALTSFEAGDFATAHRLFSALAEHSVDDTHAQGYRFLAETATHHIEHPPVDWDGVITLLEK
jgi:class 3 adenylate cyclase